VAERIYELMKAKTDAKLREMSRLLAAKPPREILGPGEFEVRDHLNEVGAGLVEAALDERAKKGAYPAARWACGCGHSAKFMNWRPKSLMSSFGAIRTWFEPAACDAGRRRGLAGC
jgi:hypothetical protein